MSARYCSFCGYDKPPFELHHLAAKKNHPHWVVNVCKDCHIIVTAWQYADRVIVAGPDTREPLNERQQRNILMLALARTAELIAASQDSLEYMLLFAALTELDKRNGELPRPKYRNPAPRPNPVAMHAQERVLAAQVGIVAYLMEETLGYDHPLPVTLRKVELQPFAWTFDNTPGIGTLDFTSPQTLRMSLINKLTAGYDSVMDDYARRWKHR